ncbi:hypothetical protein AMATHDRAFT_52085 [Amanita thiersii Skay4041]|uniref:methylated diphthine methylhydrolase n=1 Tax=Amanita thiersii Skay4041 TaxID=703135 RepID=A0A2A9P1J2_9AGAR|nr:hypothetical protein AMATHDRAFT_52085 [Amanita thiersii Skay4041]
MAIPSSGFNTVFPADSLEFCPHPQATDVFVCGTYKLNKRGDEDENSPAQQHRQGQCLVFRTYDADGTDEPTFNQVQKFDFPAIPDMKWCHTSHSTEPILAVADSEGGVTTLQWKCHETLEKMQFITCAENDSLCLSLDWSSRRIPQSSLGNLVVSVSDGSLHLLRPADAGDLIHTNTWHAHDYEPWIAAWNHWDTNIIYSGGDDLKLKAWDIRSGFSQPMFVNRRFDAGVTTIQNHPFIEHLLAVGSYNNTVYLYDMRKPLVAMSQLDVGGGVWRVKWHPHENRNRDLLVACMRDGFKVLQYNTSMDQGQVIQRFDAHQSLAYGVDWSLANPSANGKSIVGSCSFYDHVLHIWRA